MKRKIWRILIGLILLACFAAGCGQAGAAQTVGAVVETESASPRNYIEEDGEYTSKEEVALYIQTYDRLPENFITKSAAKKLGWVSKEGNLQEVAPGMSIGGDNYSNREGTLPKESGRKYKECDINYHGGYREAERIIYSNDGLIYYTDDHYNTFTLLYGN